MSNFDLSNMKEDCADKIECLKMLQLILDGEANAEQKDHFLKHHLEECLPCYKNYNLEVAIRELVKTKCCKDAPEDLIESIKSKVIQNLEG